MFYQFSFRSIFSLALIVLFATINLFPMSLSADDHTDHDNLWIHNVGAQTMTSIRYYHPYVTSGAYANIWNFSNIPVRYYWSDKLSVYKRGAGNPLRTVSDGDKGWGQPGDWISFLPWFSINMSGRKGRFTAISNVDLILKFDFNGDSVFDDQATVSSYAELTFDID